MQLTTSVKQIEVGDKLFITKRGRRPGAWHLVTFIQKLGLSRRLHFDPGNTSLRSGREIVLVERRPK